MADKEVRVKITADTSDLTKKLSNLKKELKDVASGLDKNNNNAFDKLSKDANKLKDNLNDTDKAVDNLNDSLSKTNKNGNFDSLNKGASKLSSSMTNLKNKMKDAFSDLGNNNKLKNSFTNVADSIQSRFTTLSNKIKNTFSDLGSSFKKIFSNLGGNLDISTMTKKFTAIKDSMKELGSTVLNKVATKFKDIFASGKDGTTLFSRLKNIIGDITGRIGNLGGKFKSVFSGVKNSISGIISSISNVFTAINTKSKKISNVEQYAKLEKRLKSLKEYQEKWTKEVQDTEKHIEKLNERLSKSTNVFEKRGLETGLKNYNEQLEVSMKKLKAVTDEVDKTEKKMSNLFGNETSNKATKLSEAFGEIKDAIGKIKAGDLSGGFNSLKTTFTSLAGTAKGVAVGITLVAVAVGKLAVACAKVGIDKLQRGLETIKTVASSVGNVLRKVGSEIRQAFENITGTRLDLSSAIEQTVEFESTMAQVGAISGASGKDLEGLENTARKWGATTRYSANQVGEAMTYMGMAGWSATEITQGLEGVLNLATVGCMDLGQASDFVTDGLSALGMSASQSNDFVDMLSATITKSNTGVAQMQSAFENVAPIAGTLGISMSDLSTTLGIMANSGVKAEKAGTALKNLLTNMSSPTEAMTKCIEKYNLQSAQKLITDGKLIEGIKEMKTQLDGLTASEKTNVITTIAGKEALSGVSAIMNSSTNDINELKFAVDSSTKSSRAYAQSLGLIDKEGNIVAGTFDNMVKTQGKAYEQWQNFNSVMEETTDVATFVGADMTDLGAIVAKLGEDGKVTAEQVNDVLDVFDKLQDTSEKTTKTLQKYGIEIARNDDNSINFGKTLKNLGGVWDNLSDAEKKALAEQLGFKGSIEELNELFDDNGDKIEDLVDSYEKMQGVSEHLAKSFDATLKGSILNLASSIEERLLQVFDKIKPVIQGVVDVLTTFFDIWNGMSEKFEGLKGFGDAIKYLEEQSRKWGEAIKKGLSNAIKSIDEFINGASFDNLLKIGTNIINGIADGIMEAKDNGSLDRAIDGAIRKISEWCSTNLDTLLEVGKAIIESIVEGIDNNSDKISEIIEKVIELQSSIDQATAYAKWKVIGENLMLFILKGAQGKVGEVGAGLAGLVEGLTASMEDPDGNVTYYDPISQSSYTVNYKELGKKNAKEYTDGQKEELTKQQAPYKKQTEKEFDETYDYIHQNSPLLGQSWGEGTNSGLQKTKSTTDATASDIGNGISENIMSKLETMDAEGLKELEEQLKSLQTTTQEVATGIGTNFESIRDSARTSFMGLANIVRNQFLNMTNIVTNQALNMRNRFTTQFISMSKVASTQCNNIRTAVVSKFISINKVINTQCTQARNNLTRQFISMSKVASTQLTNVRTTVVSKMISIAKVVQTQAKNARDNLTRQFMSMDRVVATQMSKCLSTVRSYMAQIASATNKQMTMKFKVEKTITTTNVTKNVQEGMMSTMSTMNSNMMAVGSPNLMSSGLTSGVININTGGGISGNLALEVPLYLDGKEVARATASYTQDELAKLSKRKSRRRGEK